MPHLHENRRKFPRSFFHSGVWDAKTGAHITTLESRGLVDHVTVAFSSDGSRLAVNSWQLVDLWNSNTSALIATLQGHNAYPDSMAFSVDGSRLVSASRSDMHLWDGRTGAHIAALGGRRSKTFCLTFSPDGSRLALASSDTTVRLWDGKNSAHTVMPERHSEGVEHIEFSLNGSRCASTSVDCTVLWDGKTGTHIATLNGYTTPVALSTDGSRLASTSFRDGTTQLWDNRGAHITLLKGSSAETLMFSADGSRLALASSRIVQLWDGRTGVYIATLEGAGAPISFSADSSRLASVSYKRTVRLWDCKTGAHIATSEEYPKQIKSITFSSDGLRLASVSRGGMTRLWDGKTGAHIATLHGDSDTVIFSRDGSILASPRDKMPWLWGSRDGHFVGTGDPESYRHLFPFSESFSITKHKESGLFGVLHTSVNPDSCNPCFWFPPDVTPRHLAFNPTHSILAIGCDEGYVIFIDPSRILSP